MRNSLPVAPVQRFVGRCGNDRLVSQMQLRFAQSGLPTALGHVVLKVCDNVKTTRFLDDKFNGPVERFEIPHARNSESRPELHSVRSVLKVGPFRS